MVSSHILTTPDINDLLIERQRLARIVTQSYRQPGLINPAVIETQTVNSLRGWFSRMGHISGTEDLLEGQSVTLTSAKFGRIDYELTKDNVTCAVTDEVMIDQTHGNPMMLMYQQAPAKLAEFLENKIYKALDTDPVSGGSIDASDKSKFLASFAKSIKLLQDSMLEATSFVMNPYTSRLIDLKINEQYGGYATYAEGSIPATGNVPRVLSQVIPDNTVYTVAARAPAIMVCQLDKVVSDTWRDNTNQTNMMGVTLYRTAFGGIVPNTAGKNAAVVKTTYTGLDPNA